MKIHVSISQTFFLPQLPEIFKLTRDKDIIRDTWPTTRETLPKTRMNQTAKATQGVVIQKAERPPHRRAVPQTVLPPAQFLTTPPRRRVHLRKLVMSREQEPE